MWLDLDPITPLRKTFTPMTDYPTPDSPTPYSLDDIVTVSQLARLLEVTPRCIQRWIRLGNLPICRTIGRRQYWLAEEIRSTIASRKGSRGMD